MITCEVTAFDVNLLTSECIVRQSKTWSQIASTNIWLWKHDLMEPKSLYKLIHVTLSSIFLSRWGVQVKAFSCLSVKWLLLIGIVFYCKKKYEFLGLSKISYSTIPCSPPFIVCIFSVVFIGHRIRYSLPLGSRSKLQDSTVVLVIFQCFQLR